MFWNDLDSGYHLRSKVDIMLNPSKRPPFLASSVSSPRIFVYVTRHAPMMTKVATNVMTAKIAGGTRSVNTPMESIAKREG